MSDTGVELKNKAEEALSKMKKIESKSELFTRRIDKNTIVSCNKIENIELYEEKIRRL